jgi:endogenous inhibitor of DNA gyrase (YacG/DUF329 family)
MPFCSHRCRSIDLHRWLGEQYRITRDLDEEPEDLEDGSPPPDDDR